MADAPRHWIRWGRYERYAGDPVELSRKVAVPRYLCKLVRRTFSLLPDGLLPYCSLRTSLVLALLHALYVEKVPLSTLARRASVARGTLRRLRTRFLRALPVLRLPPREGPLAPGAFLEALTARSACSVVDLFRAWKETEPKHAVVGIYGR